MAKLIKCLSRNAREFLTKHTRGNLIAGKVIAGHTTDRVKLWQKKLWQTLAVNTLGDPQAWELSKTQPMYFSASDRRKVDSLLISSRHLQYPVITVDLWLYKNRIYVESYKTDFSKEQLLLLIHDEVAKETKQFERLEARVASSSRVLRSRSKIPPKCVFLCGSVMVGAVFNVNPTRIWNTTTLFHSQKAVQTRREISNPFAVFVTA